MPEHKETFTLTGNLIAVLLVVLLALSLRELFMSEVKSTNHDILLMVVTFLTAKIGTIVDFFFSSSATSRKQQDTIATMASTAQNKSTSEDGK